MTSRTGWANQQGGLQGWRGSEDQGGHEALRAFHTPSHQKKTNIAGVYSRPRPVSRKPINQREKQHPHLDSSPRYEWRSNAAIDQAAKLLLLQAGWDGEDALCVDKYAWSNACDAVRKIEEKLWKGQRIELPNVAISAVPDGSIDVEFEASEVYMLANFGNKSKYFAQYYARNSAGDEIKETIATHTTDRLESLIAWLKRNLPRTHGK